MKKTVYLFVLFLIASSSYAQYVNTSHQDALEVKKRILLVALPEDDKFLLEQYEQDNAQYGTLYKIDMEGQRQALKEAVLNHWKLTDSVIVTSPKEVKTLVKKFPGKYAVLKFGEQFQDRSYIKNNNASNPPLVSWEKNRGECFYNSSSRYSVKMLGITSLVIELPKKVFEVYLPKMSPSTGDFTFALKQVQYVLSTLLNSEEGSANKLYRNINLKSEELKNKVLLIDAREKDCTEDAVKKAYPFPFKIVNYEVIENALKTKDDQYAVVQAVRFDTQNSIHYISNAATGEIYCNFIEPTFNYGQQNGAYSIRVLYPFINTRLLEKYGSGQQ
jgi:hypothetical protein